MGTRDQRLEGERILVTGAGSFVGANLLPALAATGAEVFATVRRGRRLDGELEAEASAVHEVDLADSQQLASVLAATRPSRVINLAAGHRTAHTASSRRATFTETVEVVASLIEHAPHAGATQLVQLGSAMEYEPAGEPLTEAAAPAPRTWFGAAKAAATALCLAASASGRINATVLRPFAVYGPRDKPHRLIPSAIAAAGNGGELPLTSRTVRRDWVYVGDLVEACLLALDGRAEGEVVNVATGVQHSNQEVVRVVGEAAGRRVRIAAEPEPERPWDQAHWCGSTLKAERLLGWRARTDLRTGIEQTLRASERLVVG